MRCVCEASSNFTLVVRFVLLGTSVLGVGLLLLLLPLLLPTPTIATYSGSLLWSCPTRPSATSCPVLSFSPVLHVFQFDTVVDLVHQEGCVPLVVATLSQTQFHIIF